MSNSIDNSELFDNVQRLGKTLDDLKYIKGIHVKSFPIGFYSASWNWKLNVVSVCRKHLYVLSIINKNNINIIICYSFDMIDGNTVNIVTKIHYGNNNTIIFKTNDETFSHKFNHVVQTPDLFGFKCLTLFGGAVHTLHQNVSCFDVLSRTHTRYEIENLPACITNDRYKISEDQLTKKCSQIQLGIQLQELINFDARIFRHKGHRFMHLNFFNGTHETNPLLCAINLPRMLDNSNSTLAGIQFVDIPLETI